MSSKVRLTKHKSYSLKQQLEIVDKLRRGVTRATIMKQYEVSKSTLSNIVQRSEKVRKKAAENPLLLDGKKMKLAKNPQ